MTSVKTSVKREILTSHYDSLDLARDMRRKEQLPIDELVHQVFAILGEVEWHFLEMTGDELH